MIKIDIIPFFRFIAAIIVFGLFFFFAGITITALMDVVPFTGEWPAVLISLWGALPAVVLLFTGIRLVMVMQRRPTG